MLVTLFVTQKAKLKKNITLEILEKKSYPRFSKKSHTQDFRKKITPRILGQKSHLRSYKAITHGVFCLDC